MPRHNTFVRAITWLTLAAFTSTYAMAGTVDLATSPLVTGLGKTVAPNIFFILDDSGSMDSDYMPDAIANPANGSSSFLTDNNVKDKACMRNFGYNTIYYNPNTTYSPPLNANGTSYADASFSAAPVNGFSSSSGTTDLSATTQLYTTTSQVTLASNPFTTTNGNLTVNVTHGALPDGHVVQVNDEVTISGTQGSGNPSRIGNIDASQFNGTFTVTSVVNSTKFQIQVGGTRNGNGGSGGGSNVKVTYKYKSGTDANFYYYNYTANTASPSGNCETDGSYTRVPAYGQNWTTNMTAAQRKNFANWYSYYRTRLLMMKSASGRAFKDVDDKYRVGFTTISEKAMGSTKFLDIKKFNTTQKSDWYTMLYNSSGNSYTPLRAALSKAGRYYAGKFADSTTGDHDPVQYSCQKNFTILTTDGFWNTNTESPTSDSTTPGTAGNNYGPFKMDNVTRVGDQDGASGVLAPFKDSASASNTLADVAYYYYYTDLRPAGSIGGVTDENSRIDVATNNVPTSNADPASHQHMTTFTLGLGLDGTLANPGDYSAILAGTKNWPNPITSTNPSSIQESRRIDDLWHAAVNGHGVDQVTGGNFSAKDPDAVVAKLTQALQTITSIVGSSSAAATSNLQPIDGDNAAFIAQYKTVDWTGDLVARVINVSTGAIPTTNTWSAQSRIDAQDPSTGRSIYTFSTAAANAATKLRSFTYANLSATERTYFESSSSNPGGALPQWSLLSSTQQSNATPTAMINYLRGVRTNENPSTWVAPTGLFRQRAHVLGDIVSAAPVFVRKPPFGYTDPGYTAFVASSAIVNRAPTVYVGANDGMLHALNGSTVLSDGTVDPNGGKERWAYIPNMVLKNLYRLAASDYSINHRFYVDGPIAVGDAYNSTSSTWSTILVGGLGGGGKGYYALDVTDPTNPKALWEFSNTQDFTGDTSYDPDMGYSYGNPVITKRHSDGKWVVIFASGYNNSPYNATTNPTGTGDAKGHLFVVDAFTGEKLNDIPTTTTANEDLSGVARIANYVIDGLKNNITQYVYAGDLSGALWKFDIDAGTTQRLGTTSSTAGAQPITMQPELAKITSGGNSYTVIYFGTGRYLGPNDLSSSAPSTSVRQAIYAVKDTNTDLGVLTSAGANLVSQTLNGSTSPRTSTNNSVDWSDNNGWYVTTPSGSKERFTVDPGLQLGTLVMAANIPEADYCNPTGSAILYQLSYKNGFVLTTNTFQAQVVGNTQLQLGGSGGTGGVHGGKVVIESVLADGTTMNTDQQNGGGAAGTAVRINWREIE